MRKQSFMVAGMLALGVMLVSSTAEAGQVARREARQHARIRQVVASGELTRGETKLLRQEQRTIEHGRKRALADGHIGPREHKALEGAQNRASRDIYRLKHNERQVPPAQ